MEAYLHLKAYPDVTPALHWLKDAGIRLAFLSNMTGKMLDASITNSGLEGTSRVQNVTGTRLGHLDW